MLRVVWNPLAVRVHSPPGWWESNTDPNWLYYGWFVFFFQHRFWCSLRVRVTTLRIILYFFLIMCGSCIFCFSVLCFGENTLPFLNTRAYKCCLVWWAMAQQLGKSGVLFFFLVWGLKNNLPHLHHYFIGRSWVETNWEIDGVFMRLILYLVKQMRRLGGVCTWPAVLRATAMRNFKSTQHTPTEKRVNVEWKHWGKIILGKRKKSPALGLVLGGHGRQVDRFTWYVLARRQEKHYKHKLCRPDSVDKGRLPDKKREKTCKKITIQSFARQWCVFEFTRVKNNFDWDRPASAIWHLINDLEWHFRPIRPLYSWFPLIFHIIYTLFFIHFWKCTLNSYFSPTYFTGWCIYCGKKVA